MGRMEIVQGDITRSAVDAVVNAANPGLTAGGGVCGAIHRAAGPGLAAECEKLGGCPTGKARITGGYGLPARFVIHAVGPRWQGGDHGEAELLAACYRNSLALAAEHGVKTIAFPAISCGIYGYPPAEAASIALREIAAALAIEERIERVVIVCFEKEILAAFRRARMELEASS